MKHGISDLIRQGVVKMRMENVMKRFFVLSVAALVALSAAGCASAPGSSGNTSRGLSGVPHALPRQNALPDIEEVEEYTDNGIPAVINQWYRDAPKHVLVGIGTGNLSTLEASVEAAKFSAHADLCRQVVLFVQTAKNAIPDVPQSVVDRSDFYQNAYYMMVSIAATDAAAFELYGITTIEQRLRDKDGMIWYVVTLDKNKTEKKLEALKETVKDYFESMIDDWQEK
jgi:hypothetical protein